jgi:hypothetical protein
MLAWLDAKKSEEFGASLARFFIERMPPDRQLNESKVASKTQYLLVKMSAQIEAFKQEEKLNAYKIAKLGNAFKWTLKDAGYEKSYVETLVGWLVTRI